MQIRCQAAVRGSIGFFGRWGASIPRRRICANLRRPLQPVDREAFGSLPRMFLKRNISIAVEPALPVL